MSVFDILYKYNRELLAGLKTTLLLCIWIYPTGTIFGIILGIFRYKWKYTIGLPASFFSLILSSTPIIVFLFWLHYPLQYMLNVVINPFITSVFALSILMSFQVSDHLKEALTNFPSELLESAKVCGLTSKQTTIYIQMPIIYRQILPNILFTMVTLLQATLFTSLISVEELFRVAQQINADIYRPVEIYTALAFFYVLICSTLTSVAFWIKSKYSWKLSDL